MTKEGLEAISYITTVAANEWTMLQWITVLNTIYKDGIDQDVKLTAAINFFVEKFPDFEERAKDTTQAGMDKLYDDFVAFIENFCSKG